MLTCELQSEQSHCSTFFPWGGAKGLAATYGQTLALFPNRLKGFAYFIRPKFHYFLFFMEISFKRGGALSPYIP